MATLADIVDAEDSCPPGACEHLEPAQIHALYQYKHRLIAALHRVYMQIPPSEADPILGRVLKDIASKI